MTDYNAEVEAEMAAQDDKWGPKEVLPLHTHERTLQNPKNYNETMRQMYEDRADDFKRFNDESSSRNGNGGEVGWDTILLEEVYEAVSESDLAKLRIELIQVEAVCRQMRMAIDNGLINL